jgi:RNA polymerase sigma-70 factor (ECF subfamily)
VSGDQELLRRCRSGDTKAWDAVVRRSAPMVYRLACRMLRDDTLAEDATQEAFLRMVRSIETFDPTRAFEPWACRITVNVCLRRLENGSRRELGARALMDFAHDEDGDSETSPEVHASRREILAILEQGFSALSGQDRGLLTLRYREGLSDAEVAQVCRLPVNTVKTRIFRARAQLVQHVRRSLVGDES